MVVDVIIFTLKVLAWAPAAKIIPAFIKADWKLQNFKIIFSKYSSLKTSQTHHLQEIEDLLDKVKDLEETRSKVCYLAFKVCMQYRGSKSFNMIKADSFSFLK